MNSKSFNFVISTILLITYAGNLRADAKLETLNPSGTKCTTTLSLCELDPSKITSLGLKGDKGDKGEPTDLRGRNSGRCEEGVDLPFDDGDEDFTLGDTDETVDKKDALDWGTINNPGKTTCKKAKISKTGTYYIYNSMEVVCDVNMKTTCVKINAKPMDVSFSEMKPSWLSSAGIEHTDIYNLSNTQLAWLKARSDTASIKIRYNCVNTKPAHKDTPVLLLSWNDAIIGPEPTSSSPLNYVVENDGCSTAAEDKWGSTDFVIKNTSAHRLPIIDFYVQDNMKENQQHKISVTELCFH